MRAFLLACTAVIAVALVAFAVLEGVIDRDSGTQFTVSETTRVTESDKPDPRGYLSGDGTKTGEDTR